MTHLPRFTKEIYTSTVLLPTYENVVVITVKALDNDSLSDSKLAYSIKNGNFGGHFKIDSNKGVIYIDKSE